MAKRLLPDTAYDFYARDGRDGENGPMRDSIATARKDVTAWRKKVKSWQRSVITVEWRLNEKKILALLTEANRMRPRFFNT